MGGLSVWHILLVLVVIMILFGAGKLPKVMGDLGKGIKNFKEGLNKDESPDAPKAVPSDSGATMRASENSTSETRKS